MKGNTQHLSFLAFHGQAAKHEIQRTVLRRQKREDNEILLLGQEGQNTRGGGGGGLNYRKNNQGEWGGTRCRKKRIVRQQNTIL